MFHRWNGSWGGEPLGSGEEDEEFVQWNQEFEGLTEEEILAAISNGVTPGGTPAKFGEDYAKLFYDLTFERVSPKRTRASARVLLLAPY